MRESSMAAEGSETLPCERRKIAQIVGHLLEDPGGEPPLRLLIDGRPGRQVVGHVAPLGACPHDPPKPVENLAQLVAALRGILADERQVGGDEGPLFVGNVAWVWFSVLHTNMLPLPS